MGSVCAKGCDEETEETEEKELGERGEGKGSLHVRKVQFFLTLFKKPLTLSTKVRKRLLRQLSTK